MAHEVVNNPNTVFEDTLGDVTILTSFNSAHFTADGEGFGVGSLKPRSIAAQMALYKPYNNTFDTLIQLAAGFDIATKYVHEYLQDDEYWHDEFSCSVTPPNIAEVINNQGATPYVPDTDGVFYVVDADEATAGLKAGDTVRYPVGANYVYAVIEKIGTVNDLTSETVYASNAVTKALQLRSVDFNAAGVAQDLGKATAATSVIERMFSVRGSDLSFPVQPRGTVPKWYKTYIQVAAQDTAFTQRATRDESYIDDLARKQMKLLGELKRGREITMLYSKGGGFTIPGGVDYGTEGDKAWLSDGIWHQIDGYNQIAFDPSSNTTVRTSLRTMMEHAFGAESGGPEIRQVFASAKYMSSVESAYEEFRRYYSTEYVAGVRVMRFESALGLADFMWAPILEYKAPRPGDSLRQGDGRAVALLCSVPDNFIRVEYTGEGPRMHSFIEKGGQREEYMRTEVSMGLITQLKQWALTSVQAI